MLDLFYLMGCLPYVDALLCFFFVLFSLPRRTPSPPPVLVVFVRASLEGMCRNTDFAGDSLARTPPSDRLSYSYIMYCSAPNAPHAFAPAKRAPVVLPVRPRFACSNRVVQEAGEAIETMKVVWSMQGTVTAMVEGAGIARSGETQANSGWGSSPSGYASANLI